MHTSPTTVIKQLKKLVHLEPVNQKLWQQLQVEEVEVNIVRAEVAQEVEGSEGERMRAAFACTKPPSGQAKNSHNWTPAFETENNNQAIRT